MPGHAFRWMTLSLLVGVVTVSGYEGTVLAANRDLTVMPKVAPGSIPMAGDYWAFIVGIDQYQHVPKLETAVRDATAVRDVLIERYAFRPDRITLLLNEQATRESIEEALYQLGKKAGPTDSVFIYYAGHGQVDLESQRGYWVPVEGKAQSPSTFISNALIRDEISAMRAKHVYLVADSCFSGTLFAKSRALPPLNDKFFARLYANKSRWGLTSGQSEPVADQGKNGHSMFAYFLLKLLKENDEPYLVPSHIYDQIAPLVGRNAEQQPRSEPLQNAGDEGGQFVFRLASVAGGPVPARPSGPSAGLTERQQELSALEEKERLLEEQAKEGDLDRQIEEKKKRLEEKKKKLEVASLPSYSIPKDVSWEMTGKDGAPMLLVQVGEFLYGDDKQRMSLAAFYLDKYEVTTKLYAAFLQATSREQPTEWSQQVALVGSGDRPVVKVTWHDADAYCRQYGKRLPTEQEWEKAARGTDGRKYSWGNEEPTSRHALFGKLWNGYGTLAVVGSHEAGASPYGIQDLAGNVWEWTSSVDNSNNKVLRGGSWLNEPVFLRSANRARSHPTARYAHFGFRCAQDGPK